MSAPLYMDAQIRATRSLPKAQLIRLMAVLGGLGLILCLVFFLIGATPVPFFVGLDVLALGLAFHLNNQAAKRIQQVQVSAEQVRVFEHSGRQVTEVWTSPTFFTRVVVDDLGEEEWRVRLHMSNRRLTLCRALGPAERAQFARDLQAAIRMARSERHPT